MRFILFLRPFFCLFYWEWLKGGSAADILPAAASSSAAVLNDAETDSGEDSVNEVQPATLMVNGSSAAIGSGFSGAVTVAYGTALTLSLSSGTADQYYYLAADGAPSGDLSDATWSLLTSGTLTLSPGNYYLGYSVMIDGMQVDYISGSFGMTVIKGSLATPSGLSWNGKTAGWSAVTTASGGSALGSGILGGYSVSLYKDGVQLGASQTVASNATSYDFSGQISQSGAGTYFFTVQATVSSSGSSLYNNSVVTSASGDCTTHAVSVTVVCGYGISTVSPSAASLLMSGESQNISAETANSASFGKWLVSDGDISLSNQSSAATALSVPSAYNGSNTVTVTALAADNSAPVVSSFTGASGNTRLSASVSEAGWGLSSYIFTTESDKDIAASSLSWQSASGASGTFSFNIPSGGAFYFHVRDAAGNHTRSGPLNVTKVSYHGYYSANALTSLSEYMVGSNALTLKMPVRAGFSFDGWYTSDDFSGNAVTSVSEHNTVSGIDVYAKWTRESVSFSTQPSALSFTYDGSAQTLSAAVSNSGTVTYQWYKDGAAISGATSSVCSVQNAADSGSYYVVATVTAEGQSVTGTSNSVDVVISRAALTVTADSKSISFRDAAPAYTYTCDGFVGDENAASASIAAGTLNCAYTQNSNAGNYAIIPSGFSAANYTFAYQNGTLTVSPIAVSSVDNISISLPQNSFQYSGSAITPAVTVTEGGVAMSEDDYTVSYSDNTNAGTATATVSFTRNFSGSLSGTFSITQASGTPTATLSNWVYGDTAAEPALSNNPSDGTVAWYYRAADEERDDAIAVQPTDAGSYLVYAVVATTTNYQEITTEDASFTISPRPITITAASTSWVYDGSAHSDVSYIQTGDFAGSDSFRSVSVTGSITDFGTAANVISYILASSTKDSNYSINAVNGTLSITKRPLTLPASYHWLTANPGTAAWVAVSRDNLTVSYEVKLYRVEANNQKNLVDTQTVSTGTQYDFSSAIKADCAEQGGAYSYCYTIQAQPAGGTAVENYVASAVSDDSSAVNTAYISVSGGTGLNAATIGGSSACYLIAGETASLSATVSSGYTFDEWSCSDSVITLSGASSAAASLSLSSTLASPADAISVSASATDSAPVIAAFTAANSTDLQSVTLNLQASDGVGVTAWAITQSAAAPAADASEWTSLTEPAASLNETLTVTAAGTYYAYVKDSAGSITGSDGSLSVYSVSFAAGSGGSGSMDSILKAQNTSVSLPASSFTQSGMAFLSWSGSTGLYSDQGSYAANASDTLTAQWTNEEFSYTVQYFYMGTDGSYAATPDDSGSFTALYDTEVSSSSAHIQSVLTGFSLDENKAGSITVSQNGLTLKVYYKRNSYTITYSYRIPGNSADTTSTSTFLFGAAVTEAAKPSQAGYTFVGWVYGEAGTAPSTMPASNINATGSFNSNSTTYTVVCYTQGLDGIYTLDPSLTDTKYASHAESLSFSTSDAVAVSGFTAAGVSVSYGVVGGTAASTSSSASGTASAIDSQGLYVNYYYTRNSYTLTLNVFQGLRDVSDNLKYTHSWTILYGQALTADDYSTYEQSTWTHSEGYELADYSDWSTDSAPTSMPAGDVVVTRDFVSTTESSYYVKIYYENAAAGTYTLQTTLLYYGNVGAQVTVGGSDSDTINYNSFSGYLPYFSYYVFSESNTSNVLSATVSNVNSGEDPVVLEVYFDRSVVSATITYYHNECDGTGNHAIATVTKTGRWGTTYDIAPLAYFYGASPAAENYFSAGYLASYSGYYYYEGWHWPNSKLTVAGDLSKTYTSTFGQSVSGVTNQNYVNVYYTKAVPETQYYLTVKYRPQALSAWTGTADLPLTVSVEGYSNPLEVRVANHAYVFDDSYTAASSGDYTAYPGAALLNGVWSVGALKSGFTEVVLNSVSYYTDGTYLYVLDSSNQFFMGNRVSYTAGDGSLIYTTVSAFLSDYQSNTAYASDARRSGAYVYNRGYSAIMYDNGTLTITFAYHEVYRIAYNMGGNTCYGSYYAYGTSISAVDYTDGSFPAKTGYSIVWYSDYSFATQASFPLTITGNATLYGRYEKSVVAGTDYVYYQLADPAVINGADVYYITESNRENSAVSSGMTSSTDSSNITSWFYNGALVMKVIPHSTLTFTVISLATSSYAQAGYHFDDTNTGNTLMGYCETTALNLRAYFARDTYALTVDPNNSAVSNTTVYECRFGQTVSIGAPTRDGYTFSGWAWQKWDAAENDGEGGYVTWDGGPSGSGTVSFTMPGIILKATAQWTPAEFNLTITHYFLTGGGAYDVSGLAALQGLTGAAGVISFNGSSVQGTLYSSGGSIVGASFESDGKILWFSASSATVDLTNLIAITQTVSCASEDEDNVSDNTISGYSQYSYALTLYQPGNTVETLGADDTYACVYGMSLSYYYTRGSFTVSAASKATDNLSASASITGSGSYVFGSAATLCITISQGYTFLGWYKASDVLEDGSLKSDISAYTALSGSPSYTFTVMSAVDAVAVIQPLAAAEPTVSVSASIAGDAYTLTYGYAASAANTLSASVALSGDAAAHTVVSGYQWLEDGVNISGATSSTFLIPTGKSVGSYSYTCKITLTRSDNGRSAEQTSEPYIVTVQKANMSVSASAYSGVYDGGGHTVSITVTAPSGSSDCTVYYSSTELSETNYASAGSTVNPAYTNVQLDASGSPKAYTVYYYIHDLTGNYSDATGSSTVLITPATLTLTTASAAFSKTYDGSSAVSGDLSDSSSDLYRLAHSTCYTIHGLMSGDSVSNYLVSCSATFNSRNVSTASSVTLSGLSLVNSDNTAQANYIFASDYTLLISGYITPLALDTVWSETRSFVYDGEEHAPGIALGSQSLPDTVTVSVTGAHVNEGSYTAYSVISTDDGTESSNYTITASSCSYTVTARPVAVSPTESTVGYDGQTHTLSIFSFTNGSLVSGHSYTAAANGSYINAGSYTITACDLLITDANGVDVTDNYTITYGSAALIITKRAVTFDGVTASNKSYDGTASVDLITANAVFAGIVEGDTLTLVASGSFDNANVGQNKKVTLSGLSLGGASAGNYSLNVDGSQKDTNAAITQAALSFTPSDLTVVYGESASFSGSYSGFAGSEDVTLANPNGSPSYLIRAAGSSGAFAAYTAATPAGVYDIKADVDNVSFGNYSADWSGISGRLTVSARPLSLTAAGSPTVTKVYDGTTAAASCVSGDDYVLGAVESDSSSGIITGDSVSLTFTAASFNSKDVSVANQVTLTGLGLSNANYTLSISSLDIPAAITQKALSIKADSQAVVYGSAAAFTASYTGFAANENATFLTGSIAFACSYDPEDAAHRGVGVYPITVSGLSSTNYAISFVNGENAGKITVSKAVITVTANDQSFTHGQSIPAYESSYTTAGYKYSDDSAVIPQTISCACAVTADSPAGTYPIIPVISDLTADNYSFSAVNGTMTKAKNIVTVSGVTVSGKVYDGTTKVDGSQIGTGSVAYSFSGNSQTTADGQNAGVSVTAVYASANVGASVGVTLNIELNAYLKARYYIFENGSQTQTATTTAPITQRVLTVSAADKTVSYGGVAPAYTVTYSNFAPNQSISSGSDVTGPVSYTCSYTSSSSAGSYTITPSGLASGGNYSFNYVSGTLTVTRSVLTAPVPVWDGAQPGSVTWNAVPGIGNVALSDYKLELYKGSTLVHTVSSTADTSFNAASVIRTNGAGAYTAKVTALASTENNTDYSNAADSAAGTTAALYAAKLTFVFSSDETTQAGDTSSISIKGGSSYVGIAGETGIGLAATLSNATGYTVSSCSAGSTAATITGSLSDASYTGAAALSSSLASADDITITLTLAARPATAVLTLAVANNGAKFSYTAAQAPVVTATVSVATGDNIAVGDYTYAYEWSLRTSPSSGFVTDTTQTDSSYDFPTGQRAYSAYQVQCRITATRTDNGLSRTVDTKATVVINKADLAPVLSLSGWTYGDSRGVPSVTGNLGSGAVTYYYAGSNTDEAAWNTAMPTDAGSYYVKMSIATSDDYNQYVMLSQSAVLFTISPNTLSVPTGLAFSEPTGVASWTAVDGISENNGSESASSVSVTYQVKLYKGSTLYKTYDATAGTEMDMSADISEIGSYSFTVTALSSNTSNCKSSVESSPCSLTNTNGNITAEGYTGNAYSKVYNGAAIVMSVVGVSGEVGYQWYKDGKVISGATASTLYVYDVLDSGLYCCDITSGSNQVGHSVYRTVAITKKALEITADNGEQIYNGQALNKESYTCTSNTGLAATDTLYSLTYTGSQTNVGSSSNIPSAAVIHRGAVDATANYAITYQSGTLTVTNAALTEVSVVQSGTLTYTGTAQAAAVSASATAVNAQTVSFRYCADEDGTYSSAVPSFMSAGTHRIYYQVSAPNHTTCAGFFDIVIGKAPLTVTANNKTITYGDAPANNGVSYDGFVNGQTAAVLTGTLAYSYTYAQNDSAGSYSITPGGYTEVNYAISYANGALTVQKATVAEPTIPSKVYTGGTLTAAVSNTARYNVTANAGGTSAGSYNVVLTLTDSTNYRWSSVNTAAVTLSFTITQAANVWTQTPAISGWTYGDSANAPTAVSKFGIWSVSYTGTVNDGTAYDSSAAPSQAGSYTAHFNVVQTSDYTGLTASCAFSIAKKALTVTAKDHVITYGDAPANNGVVYGGFAGSETASDLGGSLSYSYTYTRYGNVGEYLIPLSGLSSNNYTISCVDGKLTVSQKAITVRAEAKSKVYGTNEPALTYTVNAGGLLNEDTLSGSLTRDVGENVGQYAIGVGTLNNDNYAIDYTSAYLSITPAALTGAVQQSGTLTYTGAALTASLSSTVAAVNSQTIRYTYCKTQDGEYLASVPTFVSVNSYTVYYKASAPNHDVLSGSFTVTIQKATVTEPAISAKAYTGGTLTADISNAARYTVTANAGGIEKGTYDVVLTLVDSNNYRWSSVNTADVTLSFIISEAVNTWTQTPAISGWTYGQSASAPTAASKFGVWSVSYTGTENDGSPYNSGDAPSQAGSYTAHFSVPATANYPALTQNVDFTVAKAQLTVAANDHAVTYGDAPANHGVSCTGLVSGDTQSSLGGALSYQYTYHQNDPAGSYLITPSGLNEFNYVIAYVNGTLTVTNARLSNISVGQGAALTYTGTAQTAAVNASAASVNNQTVSFSYCASENGAYTSAVPSFMPAGRHRIYYKATAPNHTDSTGYFDITIQSATLTITAKNKTIVYGDAPANDGVSYSGFVNNETAAVLSGALRYAYSYTQYDDAGEYAIKPSGCTSSNYAIRYVDGALTVSKKAITVTAEAKSKEYGTAADPNLTYTVSANGLVNNDTLSGSLMRVAGEAIADYAILLGTLNHANYTITFVGALLSITKATLTVTADSQTITYGEAPTGFSVSYSGFVDGDDETALGGTLTCDCPYAQYGASGSYNITPGGYESSKYTFRYAAGTLTVQNAALTNVSAASDKSLVYNGAMQTAAVTASATAVNNQAVTYTYCATQSGAYSASVPAFKDAGEHRVYYIVAAPNHDAVSGSFVVTISKAALTITANDHAITYGDAPANNSVTYAGFKGADSRLNLGGTLSYTYNYKQNDAVGEYRITPYGYSDTNYTISYKAGTLTVQPAQLKDLRVTQSAALVFSGLPQIAAVSASAQSINSQPVSFVYSTSQSGAYSASVPAFTEAGEYTVYYKASAPNHETVAGSFTIVIGEAETADTNVTSIDALISESELAGGLDVWRFQGGISYENLDRFRELDYSDDSDDSEIWCAVMHGSGYDDGIELVIEQIQNPNETGQNRLKLYGAPCSSYASYSQQQLEGLLDGLDQIAVFDIYLQKSGVRITEFSGTYYVLILLPKEMRSVEDFQIVYENSNGSVEVFETLRDGNYIMFSTTHFSDFQILGRMPSQINLWPLIILMTLMLLIELCLFIRIRRKRQEERSQVTLRACALPAALAAVRIIPKYGVLICIILGILVIAGGVVLLCAALRGKTGRQKTDQRGA